MSSDLADASVEGTGSFLDGLKSRLSTALGRADSSTATAATRRLLGLAVAAGLILLPTFTSSPYLLSLGSIVAVDAALALSVVVLMGFAGELSFAYGVLFGAGAYLDWAVAQHIGPEWVALVLGTLGATFIGAVVAIPAVRVRGLQLALATFAMGLAGGDIFGQVSGYSGTVDVKTFTVFGHPIESPAAQVTFWGVIVAILYLVVALVLGSRIGRRLLLLRSDEPTARSLGINTSRQRGLAFAMSAFILGLVGSIYPSMLGLLDPSTFSFQTVVTVLIIVFVGGSQWPEGALVGAVAIVAIGQSVGSTPGLESLIYGAGLVVILAVAPQGLLGLLDLPAQLWRGSKGRAHSDRAVEAVDGGVAAAISAVTPLAQSREVEATPAVVLSATGLKRSFGNVHAVTGVDLVVRRGQILAIAGANGAGKSTLLDLLTGFQRPDEGTVTFVDRTGQEIDITRLRSDRVSRLGVVRTFQFPGLVPELSIGDNVRIAPEARGLGSKSVADAVARALEIVGLRERFRESGANLPHGTRKLVDLARVICEQPEVALFDEPSSGLGGAEIPWLARGLRALADGGAAVVVIEHNLEFIGLHADQIVVLDFGRVIAHGDPDEVLSSPEVQHAYLGKAPTEHEAPVHV
ncbi:MAG TPA: ATP-binding cassette domain-containing protein [Acidimicrobiales bacterium]|jgi:ABC-type branched-subunit amino acid transport system ATPase component/ABC-type branched-subunit amino acid transport system permease subunit|nr:ATP-binding cassette domain-containing protein [Acidimicrobiales bacterium]